MQIEPCTSSASLTVATTTVVTKAALLQSVILNPAAAASSITIYDNGSAASGSQLVLLQAVANGASIVFTPTAPLFCANGITVVVAGSGATAQVYFQRAEG